MLNILLIFISIFFIAEGVLAKEIHLMTYEAPPFVSESLPEQGAAIYALREIFKKTNCELKVSFAPFLRGRKLALKEELFVGFFPVTQVNVTSDFTMSKVIFQTPWAFAERKDKPITWKAPEDVLPYRIGNASGYELAAPFQPFYAKKKLKVEPAPSDELNLLKLANKRVDLVFIDAGMFTYLIKTSEKLKPFQNQLQLNPKIIHMDQYGIAFKKTPIGLKQMEEFNKAASEEEFTRYIDIYFKKYPGP
ncbi:substrate-binding periplasmic protein [Bdellovibrio bacteriovorus]|uniref:substrate-binding periplasmic protein n=1 Tax=Bdellovibrio TaxID=958 RepID=UPI0035A99BEC